MQGSQALFSLGAALGPVIVRPYLGDVPPLRDVHNTSVGEHHLCSNRSYYQSSTIIEKLPIDKQDSLSNSIIQHQAKYSQNQTTIANATANYALVRFSYVNLACFALPPAVMFGVLFAVLGPSCRRKRRRSTKEGPTDASADGTDSPSMSFHVVVYVVDFIQCIMYGALETVLSGYLAPFVVEGLRWHNTTGAWITAVYWGSQLLGRSLGVLLALWLKPIHIIAGNVLLVSAGSFLLLFVCHSSVLVWIAAGLCGLGLSTFLASNILNVARHIQVKGRAGATFYAGVSVGTIVGPTIVGRLFETYGAFG